MGVHGGGALGNWGQAQLQVSHDSARSHTPTIVTSRDSRFPVGHLAATALRHTRPRLWTRLAAETIPDHSSGQSPVPNADIQYGR